MAVEVGPPRGVGFIAYCAWLARYTPRLLFRSTNAVVTCAGVVLALLVFTSRKWAGMVEAAWSGVNPVLGFVPVALIFVYGVLRANYEAIRERDILLAQSEPLADYEALLAVYEAGGVLLKRRYSVEDVNAWVAEVRQLLERLAPEWLDEFGGERPLPPSVMGAGAVVRKGRAVLSKVMKGLR